MTAILSNHSNPIMASAALQTHLQSLENWTCKWRIKINEEISKCVTFSLRRENCPQLLFYQIAIPPVDSVKYRGLQLDRRLTWKHHISTLRKHCNHRSGHLKTEHTESLFLLRRHLGNYPRGPAVSMRSELLVAHAKL